MKPNGLPLGEHGLIRMRTGKAYKSGISSITVEFNINLTSTIVKYY